METHTGSLPQFSQPAAGHPSLDWVEVQDSARLAAIVSCSPDAIISLDATDGRILTWNPAATQLFGYTEQEAIGTPFTLLAPQPDKEKPSRLFQAALEGLPLRVETVRRRKDGRPVEVSMTAARIMSPDGRIVALVAILRDITARRRTERALAAQSRLLGMLYRRGALVPDLDDEEVIRSAAEAGLELTAAQMAAFVSAGADTGRIGCLCCTSASTEHDATCRFFPLDSRTAPPDDFLQGGSLRIDDIREPSPVARAIAAWARRLQLSLRSCLIVPAVSRDGDLLGGFVLGHVDPAHFTQAHEELVCSVASQAAAALDTVRQYQEARREIEERRQTEAVLRASEAQFRLLADAMPQMVWSTSANNESDFYNLRWRAYFGLPAEEMAGDKWLNLVHPDDRDRIERTWLHALESGEPYEAEYRLRRHDGAYRWFLDRGLPLRGDDGRILRWIGTCTDIDEQKQAEMESRRLREVVEQSPDFIGYAGPDGRMLYLNPAGRSLIGLPDAAALGDTRFEDFFDPGDWQLVRDTLSRRGEAAGHWSGESRLRRFDTGVTVPVDYRVFTTQDSAGNPTGFAAITRDISTRKSAEEARQLLIQELNHRVKNLFAIASGIVSMSARTAGSPGEMAEVVRGRLSALARAHDLVRATVTAEASGGEPTTLQDVLTTITAPHVGGGSQIVIDGPAVVIGAGTATSIALVLHELSTNAVKHGALSTPDGRVRIAWTTDDARLALSWQESGGPPIEAPPAGQGFGLQLARMTVAGQLGGTIETGWEAEGVRVAITIPLDRLAC